MYELVITNGKGYGLFATHSIPRGTRVLEELPLITTPSLPVARGIPTLNIEKLTQTLGELSPKQHEVLFDLYHNPDAAAEARQRIHNAQERSKHEAVSPNFPNA